jgi:hypothetical protein
MPRTPNAPQPRAVMEIDWPFFGELCRALALKVSRDYAPDLVVGIARAGVIPGAVVASILRCDFASITASRMHEGEAPSLVSRPCDSGDTLRLASSVMREEGAASLRTAVSIRTGEFRPDYWALQTEAFIILPWDRWVVQDGELVIRPDYQAALAEAAAAGGPPSAGEEPAAPRRKAAARRKRATP